MQTWRRKSDGWIHGERSASRPWTLYFSSTLCNENGVASSFSLVTQHNTKHSKKKNEVGILEFRYLGIWEFRTLDFGCWWEEKSEYLNCGCCPMIHKVNWDDEHWGQRQTPAKHLRPNWIMIRLVVSQRLVIYYRVQQNRLKTPNFNIISEYLYKIIVAKT